MARARRPRTERTPSKGGSPPAASVARANRDPLGPYREKRDFGITPEPRAESSPASVAAGKETTALRRGRFVVQRHDARRLHYDVRLEIEGAMMSFAVPKGPSYDPEVKRLAVEVEDHPIAYNEFEGEIPAGQYGAGEVLLWDRGTFETIPPGQMRPMRDKGHLHVRFFGDKLKGEWHFVKTKGPEAQPVWMMMKVRDRYADPSLDIVATRPESVRGGEERSANGLLSMMSEVARATTPHFVPSGPSWTYEIKYDGYRVLAAKARGEVRLCSRNSTDFTDQFPPVVEAVLGLPADEVVLDGEVVAIDEHGASSFECLQEWITNQVKGWPQTRALAYAVFDVLWLDGRDLRRTPIEERRAILREVLAQARPPLTISTALEGDGQEVLKTALAAGLEGLIAKKKGSPYVSGPSDAWLKLKGGLRQEFAVIGYVPLEGGTVAGALVLAVMGDDGKFHFAGKVGTGFSDLQRREWSQRLDLDRVPEPPAIDLTKDVIRDKPYWVTPKHVVEVRFDRWLKENVIRFPSFVGHRLDKRPEQCRREQPAPSAAREEQAPELSPLSRRGTVAVITNPD
jgi:bifunctional non-homologous end joining protein LigD